MISRKISGPVVLVAIAFAVWIFHHTFTPRIAFIMLTQDWFSIQDFAYHIFLTEHLLTSRTANIYNPEIQMAVLSANVNAPLNIAMPVGATPVAFFVWIPFALLSRFSLPLSYTLWVTFSIAVLVFSVWKIFYRRTRFPDRRIFPLTLIALTLFSAVGFLAVLPGQTSILAAGLISLLIFFLHTSEPYPLVTRSGLLILIVFLAGLKPTYMVICFGALWIYDKKLEFVAAGMLLGLFLAFVTPFLTTAWLPFYFQNLGMYLFDKYPDFYSWSVVPRTMNTFAGAFGDLIGRRTANVMSLTALFLTWVWIIASPRLKTESIFFSWLRLNRPRRVILLMAGCLLFAPYSGTYEDLLFIPVFVTFGLSGRAMKLRDWRAVLLCCLLVVCLFHNLPWLAEWGWAVFILKAVVLGAMTALVEDNRQEPDRRPRDTAGKTEGVVYV